VIYGLATGRKIAPAITHKYAAAMTLESGDARETWVNIGFPAELRRWLKSLIPRQSRGFENM
jgi:hypothetical protein